MPMQLDAAFNYNDIQGLETLKSGARNDDPKALRAVAQQFESMFISLIMKSMRDATDVMESDLENSYQTKFYRDMYDQQLSLSVSQNGGFGLADVLYEQLLASQNPARPDLYNIDVKGLDDSIRPVLPFRNLDTRTQSMIDALSAPMELPTDSESPLFPATAQESNEQVLPMSVAAKEGKGEVFNSPKDFIQSLLPIAQKVTQDSNLDPTLLVAQAALETGWGKFVIENEQGESSFNFFGIKADQRWGGESANTTTHEFIDGRKLVVKAPFRAYQSAEDSFADYVKFIEESPRYQEAVAAAAEPEKYAQALQQAGYATDPNYADKIIRIKNSDWFAQA